MQTICFGIGSLSLMRTGWIFLPPIIVMAYMLYHEWKMRKDKKTLMQQMEANNKSLVEAVDKNTKAVIELKTMITTLS